MASQIVEPPASGYEPEYRGLYRPAPSSHTGVIVQGSVAFPSPTGLQGNEDDAVANIYAVRLLVGPFWRDVESVVPKVTIDSFRSVNPDEDDFMHWEVSDLTWDTVGEFGPSQDELRIRLKFEAKIQGEHAFLSRFGYYLMASGRRLGEGGINQPGPVKPQG